jgi:murein DD-endopeptidase MepM/ murein hydrolase activator NlpD
MFSITSPHFAPFRLSQYLTTGLTLVLLILLLTGSASAQEDPEDSPYYIVQPGDSLWDIAWRFGVSVEDLQNANDLSDPGQISIESRLAIPGLEGIQGRVGTTPIPFGENLRSMSRRYGLEQDHLARVNRVVNPSSVYTGWMLVVPLDADPDLFSRTQLKQEQSLLEMAIAAESNPWKVASFNNLGGPSIALPGDVLLLPGESDEGPAAVSDHIQNISLEPARPMQGKTIVLKVTAPQGLELHGSLAGIELNFFSYQDGYLAIQGIPAMLEPGLYSIDLEGEFSTGGKFSYSQAVLVRSGNYPYDPPLLVDPETLEDEVVNQEEELWSSLALLVSPDKLWDGPMGAPVPIHFSECWTSHFGSRRSYNGSEYKYYHAGLDFCGGVGTELYAPSPGRVVYTGSLVIRGDVVVLDHGWGVYTAYAHLSEILVAPRERVETGQIIGKGGSTGRSTGPHLHWEVWVGGYPVDPMDWLEREFP